jgi:phage gpG-like protein
MAIIRGDWDKFKELQDRLNQLSQIVAPGSPDGKKLVDLIGEAFKKELADEFKQSRDPYGNPWKPLARQRNRARDRKARERRIKQGKPLRGDKVLVDTGRMSRSVAVRGEPGAVRIILPTSYASFHQYGAADLPRRQMLPELDTGGLGSRWSMAAEKAVARFLERMMGKKL